MPSGPGPFGPPYHVAVPPSRHPSPSSARAAPRASANANARRCVVRDARGARRAVRVAESRSECMSCRFARRSFRVGPEREARCEAGARLCETENDDVGEIGDATNICWEMCAISGIECFERDFTILDARSGDGRSKRTTLWVLRRRARRRLWFSSRERFWARRRRRFSAAHSSRTRDHR